MEGRLIGDIRVVTSGNSGQVSSGGAVISESELVFSVDYQDGETFIGRSQSSDTSGSSAGISVWARFVPPVSKRCLLPVPVATV